MASVYKTTKITTQQNKIVSDECVVCYEQFKEYLYYCNKCENSIICNKCYNNLPNKNCCVLCRAKNSYNSSVNICFQNILKSNIIDINNKKNYENLGMRQIGFFNLNNIKQGKNLKEMKSVISNLQLYDNDDILVLITKSENTLVYTLQFYISAWDCCEDKIIYFRNSNKLNKYYKSLNDKEKENFNKTNNYLNKLNSNFVKFHMLNSTFFNGIKLVNKKYLRTNLPLNLRNLYTTKFHKDYDYFALER